MIEEDVPLAPRTTLQVGGPARFLARCHGEDELLEALCFARDRRLPSWMLGGGSNVLVADAGLGGMVVELTDTAMELESDGDEHVRLRAAAGAPWDALVELAVEEGLAGLECLSGIPGKVGAAPMQNIGAYGQEVAETLESVEVLDRARGTPVRIAAAECGFAYRQSHFKGRWRERFVILGVTFRLPRHDVGTLRYPELAKSLGTRLDGAAPRLAELRAAVLEVRRRKSMVIDPNDPNRRSAGSFFTNPVVDPEVAERTRAVFGGGSGMPTFPMPDGRVKLSAAWLIENRGFSRGFRLGRAALSSNHCLALINPGGASAADLVALAAHVRGRVRDACGVTLRPEPVFLGFGDETEVLLDRLA
jgi:UDP-N-acetylmuramate dehydrogenase